MKRTFLLLLSLALVAAGCAVTDALARHRREPGVKASGVLPSSSQVAGWTQSGFTRVFAGKKLYDYIDGAGEVFLKYDFAEAATAEYERGKTGEIMTIDVYDMTSPQEAFGIYTYARYPGCKLVDAGNEGFITETSLDFWKGHFYVKIQGFEPGGATTDGMKKMAAYIAGKIEERPWKPPAVFSLLPREKQRAQSAKFFHEKLVLDGLVFISEENVFGLSRATDCAWAEYEDSGEDAKVLLVAYPSAAAAEKAFQQAGGVGQPPAGGRAGVREVRGVELGRHQATILSVGGVVEVIWTDSDRLRQWLTESFMGHLRRVSRSDEALLAGAEPLRATIFPFPLRSGT